jgi:type IV fimbrial biogenesis protein FimT
MNSSNNGNSKSNSTRQRGFTLIEAAVTTSVVAVLVGVGVPSFTRTLDLRTLEGVSTELANDLQYVRSEAVARNVSLRLTTQPLPSGGACYVIHAGSKGDCICAGDGTASCAEGLQPLKTVVVGGARRVSLSVNSASMLWHPVRGTVTPTGTLQLTLTDGRAIHHIVNIMGRSKTCSPEGGVRGHAVCPISR